MVEFERHYDASGAWAQLFRKNAGFQGTQLLRDAENSRRYLTVDRWEVQGGGVSRDARTLRRRSTRRSIARARSSRSWSAHRSV